MNAKAKARPPVRTLHRGSVLAAGVIVDPELTSEDEAKRRVFELALRGADVRRHGTRYVVCFHAPVRLLEHEAPGQVLTRSGELLLTAPS